MTDCELAIGWLFLTAIYLILVVSRLAFKVGYYEQKLKNAGIKDSVKDMPWWRITLS